MPDAAYRTYSLVLKSQGIDARSVDDTLSAQSFLNMDNCEELAEGAVTSRLGSQILNRTGNTINPLTGSTAVHSLQKLAGLNGDAWRYAGSSTSLFRRAGLTQGPYTVISTTMSGQPWQGVVYRPEASSMPYLFLADAAGMLKDNGTLAAPQQMGIFQPQYPVIAQAQAPDFIALDNFTSGFGSYSYTGTSGSDGTYVNTTTTSAVAATGVRSVNVADTLQPGLFQLLTIDTGPSQETVLVIKVTPTGFVADFTKTHSSGVTVVSLDLQATIPASSNPATISKSFAGTPISAWPTTLQQADYIGLYVFVSNPQNINSITIKFDCGDGTFQSDYFWKVIGQGALQELLDTANSDPATAATDAILSQSLNIYGSSTSSIVELNTGSDQWSPLLIQLSDFAGSGRANFDDPVFNWSNVNGYQISVVTNTTGSADLALAALVLFGGAGPDSFAGVAYDYRATFYNAIDGSESNPSMAMTNVNPPLDTNWVLPRRQPVKLTLKYQTLDPQVTHWRIYRRGGTLGDNWRRIDQVPITGSPQTYVDIAADVDIQAADLLSLLNDVPVTSTLPTPVNTTLVSPIATTNQQVSVFPVSMDNISVAQQVLLGSITPTGLTDTSEIVIVLAVFSDHFTAFVQNTHEAGEMVSATAKYGQPVTIMAEAFNYMYFAGDTNNPHYLYFSSPSNPQAVGSANYIEVGTPDDPITAIVKFGGNLYVSTRKYWWSLAPGTNGKPTVYPTRAKFGCVAPLGFVVTEEGVYYQAIDGIRFFAGGASSYLTQNLEFIFQGIGSTPIVEADQTQLAQTRAAFWNSMIFFSYIGMDGNRHRLILHTQYKRWRNDDIDAQALLLEADTNSLIFGDSAGLVHQDRMALAYDEANSSGELAQAAIAMDFQLPYLDQGAPEVQKNYNEVTVDINTNGTNVIATLLFNDGEFSLNVATINTTERQKVNLTLNDGDGVEAYKVSLQLTCAVTQRVYVYQAAIRAVLLARTRTSMDTYWLRDGTDSSKTCKQVYLEYQSSAEVTCRVFYDQNPVPFTFTLQPSDRQVQRVRLPAVKYRMRRIVLTGGDDFQLWDGSKADIKEVASGKGYEVMALAPNG